MTYRTRAVNTATASDNKIHDDRVAAAYGFRGGLVPGVTVYGYMAKPVIETLGGAWEERGSIEVSFRQPFYDGDQVVARTEPVPDGLGSVRQLACHVLYGFMWRTHFCVQWRDSSRHNPGCGTSAAAAR